MKQTIFFLFCLFSIVIIGIIGCKKVTKEESPETIAANLLKQGTADPELLPGEYDLIKFAYTPAGNKISDRNAIVYQGSQAHPRLLIPKVLSNEWWFYYINHYRSTCTINSNLINFLKFGPITMIHAPVEDEIASAFLNAYSFVIKGNELIIYFKGDNGKNLLILEKQIEETPETIAENLLKKGTADPALLPGTWIPSVFAYTFNGITIFDRNSILYGLSQDELPLLEIPDDITNNWSFYFYNHYLCKCSLNENLINFSYLESITGMEPKAKEQEVVDAFRNALSFVYTGHELIIYFKDRKDKNLLILEKL